MPGMPALERLAGERTMRGGRRYSYMRLGDSVKQGGEEGTAEWRVDQRRMLRK